MIRPNTPSDMTLNWPAPAKTLFRRGSLKIWFDPGMGVGQFTAALPFLLA